VERPDLAFEPTDIRNVCYVAAVESAALSLWSAGNLLMLLEKREPKAESQELQSNWVL
jgi:hypothetical protein